MAAVSGGWREQGNAALGRGDLAEAGRCYEQGVLAHAQDAALRLNLGFVLLEQGRYAAAADRLREAMALRRPGDDCAPHDAYFFLARAQIGLGQYVQAAASFEAALADRPDFPEALGEGARLLHSLGRNLEAEEWLRRLVRLRPTGANRLALAAILRANARDAEALEALDGITAADPEHLEAAILRCGAFTKLGRFAEALVEADRALGVAGPVPRLLANRAIVLDQMGRGEEALADVDRALALDPGNRDALLWRCNVLTNLLRMPEAIAAGESAVQRLPDDADLHFSLGLALLVSGDLRRGWPEHEWRLRGVLRGKMPNLEGYRRWAGEDLSGRTIFVYDEQGIGDAIQFVRFAHVLARSAASVLVMVTRALEPLVARSLPANCRVLPQNSPLPRIDFHCPMMSLPAVLGTTTETVPSQLPYLRADEAAVRRWRAWLGTDRPNVGVTWSGNPEHRNDHHRSMPLATFQQLAVAGCRYVSLQPRMRDADRAPLANWPDAVDAGRELRDFADTAALVEALDLVVTVDTSVAHLAGALGKPVWILLPYSPDWRWMLERADSPWYPTARLYRQPGVDAWPAVLQQVRADLAALVHRR